MRKFDFIFSRLAIAAQIIMIGLYANSSINNNRWLLLTPSLIYITVILLIWIFVIISSKFMIFINELNEKQKL